MKTILIYSGGLDSTVLLYRLINTGHIVKTLSFYYKQKHKKEIEVAKYFTNKLNISHTIVNLPHKLLSSSCLTSNQKVPEGHYEEESMKNTVVPNRNMIMLSLGVAFAINEKYNNVAFAGHSGDHAIYPDCRKIFVDSLDKTCKLGNWEQIDIIAPFINFTKKEIVETGKFYNVEMSKTWSCYNGRKYHCGKCGTCVERKEAFQLSNIKDNTVYEL